MASIVEEGVLRALPDSSSRGVPTFIRLPICLAMRNTDSWPRPVATTVPNVLRKRLATSITALTAAPLLDALTW